MFRRAGVIISVMAAGIALSAPAAFAVEPPPGPNTGTNQGGLVNLNLLNNLAVCPNVTALLGLGNVLGILGLGGVAQHAGGANVVCVIDTSVTQRKG